ncbi:cytochrome C oxidase subunit II [Paenibacillus sp. GSMTC-2017]|uniref:cytochrome C oxidase subunit II n=1 Tax=Paenibacillus sp. GSMTC-2017 TaxID=2794350 RepID=UPI0018D61B76|nr:cytochrome C oxidase subunit II [Paenibacillus sp. GSMTC-2017]MBH5318254.1 cytochrome C oxidase subunit II [Paenibacillus sp. GSMTC-2017]
MHKWIMFIVFTAASLLGLFLLTFKMPDKPVDESALLPPGVSLMKIVASNDFTFNQEVFTAKVGDKVIMKLQNKSGVHGIKIDALNVSLDNDTPETQVEFTEPGEYEIYCSIACGVGHKTMKAKLVIEAA